MLIRKEKNFAFVFILGIILLIIGIIYGVLNNNLGVLLLLVIFGLLFMGLATFKNILRYKHFKKLQEKINNNDNILGYIFDIRKVTSGGAKIINDNIYELVVEIETFDGNKEKLISNWVDEDYIKENNLEKGKHLDVYFYNSSNYYFKF